MHVLLALLLAADAPGRGYHAVALDKLAASQWTHVCVTGPVVYRRHQEDGDWHITLDDGRAKVVLEIIPLIPLPPPAKGDVVTACGITRQDKEHGWPELHPVETITVIRGA